MRGEKVIARGFDGVAVVLRVWDVGDGVAYLATDTEFEKREAGRTALEPVGFPLADVFTYEKGFAGSGRDWQRLKRWRPMKAVS